VPAAAYAKLTFGGELMKVVHIPEIEAAVGEVVTGRTGGAVSLAVGMAQIFSALPGMKSLLAYWYHFAIMFEALFILTTIDSGTRVARFLMQEFGGRVYKPFARTDSLISGSIATALIVFAWGYFIYTGQISTIWPMFGVANQLLGSVALAVGTTVLINLGKAKYAWTTIVPFLFLATNTFYGGFLNVRDNYYPLAIGTNAARNTEGWVLTICTSMMMILAVVILGSAVTRWVGVLNGSQQPATAEG
jgi:carbon starvation protein